MEMETGAPFRIDTASGPTFYGKSAAAIQGDRVSLQNHVQMANFEKWTDLLQVPKKPRAGPAHASASVRDRLTITGAEGTAYLLPIYELDGSFVIAGEKFLDSWIAVCPGTGPRCIPKLWGSSAGVSSVHESYQPAPDQTLEVRMGKPFLYFATIYSFILPQRAKVTTALSGTFRQDHSVESTVRLVGVSITDQQGKEIRGVQVTSESGFPYPVMPPGTAR